MREFFKRRLKIFFYFQSMETLYFVILSIVVIFFIFDKIVDYLNTLNWSDTLPKEAEWIYDQEKICQIPSLWKNKAYIFKLFWNDKFFTDFVGTYFLRILMVRWIFKAIYFRRYCFSTDVFLGDYSITNTFLTAIFLLSNFCHRRKIWI